MFVRPQQCLQRWYRMARCRLLPRETGYLRRFTRIVELCWWVIADKLFNLAISIDSTLAKVTIWFSLLSLQPLHIQEFVFKLCALIVSIFKTTTTNIRNKSQWIVSKCKWKCDENQIVFLLFLYKKCIEKTLNSRFKWKWNIRIKQEQNEYWIKISNYFNLI